MARGFHHGPVEEPFLRPEFQHVPKESGANFRGKPQPRKGTQRRLHRNRISIKRIVEDPPKWCRFQLQAMGKGRDFGHGLGCYLVGNAQAPGQG